MKIVSAKELRLNLGEIVADIVNNGEIYTLVFGRGPKAKKIKFGITETKKLSQ